MFTRTKSLKKNHKKTPRLRPETKKKLILVSLALLFLVFVILIILLLPLKPPTTNNPPTPPEPPDRITSVYFIFSGENDKYARLLQNSDNAALATTLGVGTVETGVQELFDSVAQKQLHNPYGNERYVFLLQPGEHGSPDAGLHVQLGYYTSVIGTGQRPEDTVWHGTVSVPNDPNPCVGALNNFYRGIHNFTLDVGESENHFSTSQACPIRDMVVRSSSSSDPAAATFALSKFDPANEPEDICKRDDEGNDLGEYSSGGFMANCQMRNVEFGTQQQFFVRDSSLSRASGGAWNIFFARCTGDFQRSFGGDNVTLLNNPDGPNPRSAPRLLAFAKANVGTSDSVTDSNRSKDEEEAEQRIRFAVDVSSGPESTTVMSGWSETKEPTSDLKSVVFVTPDNSANEINSWLGDRSQKIRALVFCPGVYYLDESLNVTVDNSVLMGLGYATLIAANGNSAIVVEAEGVSLSGFIIEAGNLNSDVLLQVGGRHVSSSSSSSGGDRNNPTVLYDIFTRTATREARATTMIEINQDHTIIDHCWNWRADHVAGESGGLGSDQAVAMNGLVVNADYVTAYGLFSEHFLKYCVWWKGHHGTIYFQQTELPYDVVTTTSGEQYDKPGLRIDGSNFQGFGIGVYTYFNNKKFPSDPTPNPTVSSAVQVATKAANQLSGVFTVFLNGGGQTLKVVNDTGTTSQKSTQGKPQRVSRWPPPTTDSW